MKLFDAEPRDDFDPASLRRARAGVLLGLLFLSGPLADLAHGSYGPAQLVALLLGLAVFVALYVSLLPPSSWLRRLGPRAWLVALALLPLIAIALLLAGAPNSFGALFVYFVVVAGLRLPEGAAIVVTLATCLGISLAGRLHGVSDSAIAATVLTIAAIGFLMTAFGRIARANSELRATRKELARTASSAQPARSSRASPSRRSACGSPATCTISSATASP